MGFADMVEGAGEQVFSPGLVVSVHPMACDDDRVIGERLVHAVKGFGEFVGFGRKATSRGASAPRPGGEATVGPDADRVNEVLAWARQFAEAA